MNFVDLGELNKKVYIRSTLTDHSFELKIKTFDRIPTHKVSFKKNNSNYTILRVKIPVRTTQIGNRRQQIVSRPIFLDSSSKKKFSWQFFKIGPIWTKIFGLIGRWPPKISHKMTKRNLFTLSQKSSPNHLKLSLQVGKNGF